MNKSNLIAGIALTALPGSVASLHAWPATEAKASPSQASVKGDRLDIRPLGTACGKAWPYYDSTCLRDPSRPAGRVPKVRIVSADRSPAQSLQRTAR